MKKTIIKTFVGKVLKTEVITIADGPHKGEKAIKITYADADIDVFQQSANDAKQKVIFCNELAIAAAETLIAEGKNIPDRKFNRVLVEEMPPFIPIYQEDGARRDGSTYKKGETSIDALGRPNIKYEMTLDILLGGSVEEDASAVALRIISDKDRFQLVDTTSGEIPVNAEDAAK